MLRAFAAGAGAAFMAFLGFLLTVGGIVVTVKYAIGHLDRLVGKSIRSAFTPPML